jgi:hypothetical protein
MASVRRLCAERGERRKEVLAWDAAAGHRVSRVRRGTRFRLYIRPRVP